MSGARDRETTERDAPGRATGPDDPSDGCRGFRAGMLAGPAAWRAASIAAAMVIEHTQ